MNESTLRQLTTLQYADSFFPSGAVAFSFGLETLVQDGVVQDAGDVQRFLCDQIEFRWASADRVVLSAAWQAGSDMSKLQQIDALQESMTISQALREGSRRAGAALLSVHRELNTIGAQEFSDAVSAEQTPGHLNVVQGLAWRGGGLALESCQLISAHSLCVGVLGAALRLSVIGHLNAQRILTALHPVIDVVLHRPMPPLECVSAYSPLGEIATMRHVGQISRLFSN